MDVAIEKPELLGAKQEWLHQTLAADTTTPTIFVWHYAPYNRAGVSSCGFRVPDWSPLGKRALLEILQAAPNVFVTLNGHDHWDEVNRLEGITHVQNAAFVEWPNTFRLLRVFPDRIEWEVRQVAIRGYVRIARPRQARLVDDRHARDRRDRRCSAPAAALNRPAANGLPRSRTGHRDAEAQRKTTSLGSSSCSSCLAAWQHSHFE